MKWERRTSLAHCHCSAKVGILCCNESVAARAQDASQGSAYCLDLVLLEVWDLVHDHEGQSAAEVDQLVHNEGHDARGKHIILHVGVPRGPCLLEHIEVDVVLSDLVEMVGVADRHSSRSKG